MTADQARPAGSAADSAAIDGARAAADIATVPASGALGQWATAHAATLAAPAGARLAGQAPRRLKLLDEPEDVTPSFDADPDSPSVLSALSAVGADGHILVVTSNDLVPPRIWDVTTGHLRHVLARTSSRDATAWGHLPGGQLILAVGHPDGTVEIVDPDTGHLVTSYSDRGGDVERVEWHDDPGGVPWLVTGGTSGQVNIRNGPTGSLVREIATQDGVITCTAAGRLTGGRRGLVTGGYQRPARIWDPDTGQLLLSLTVDGTEPRNSYLWSAVWGRSQDGRALLATGTADGAVRIWDPEADTVLRTFSGHGSHALSLLWPDRPDWPRILVSAGNDRAARIWDVDTGAELNRLPSNSQNRSAISLVPGPDGDILLVVASGQEAADAGAPPFRVWRVATGGPPASAPTGWPAERGPRGRLVVPPEEVQRGTAEAPQDWAGMNSVACAALRDGRTLVATAGSGEGGVQLWDLESGHHLWTITGHSDRLYDVALAQAGDGRLLLATGSQDGTSRIWDPETGRQLHVLTGHSSNACCVAWGARRDGTLLLATGSVDRTARIWDPETGRQLHALTGHTATIYSVAWGARRDGTLLLATGSADRTARIWDPVTGREIGVLTGHTDAIDTVAWTTRPDGTWLLVTGSQDGTSRIWDPETGQEQLTLRHPSSRGGTVRVTACTTTADGRVLLATANSELSVIWDADTRAILAELPGTGSIWRSAAWTRDRDGNLLLVLVIPDLGPRPFRAWLVETAGGYQARPPGQAGRGPRQAAQASRQLLRLGSGGLWPSLGLLADLVALTGPDGSEPATALHDPRLTAVANEPGIARLRDLSAGKPRWTPDARTAFAALLAAGLDTPARYAPPDGAEPALLAAALAAALADGTGNGIARWAAPVAAVRAAIGAVDERMLTLLAILGPDACAADPLLPLRLAGHAPQLPVLAPRELQFLAGAASSPPANSPAATVGTLAYSPGTAGVARSGPPTRLLPTQLALPPDLRTTRLADNQLLYRQHRAPAPPVPEPVTLILDTTPPTYGPAGQALRLVAHLLTTTLWAHGHHPYLITLATPQRSAPLRSPADLLAIWTSGTLTAPQPALTAALTTATQTGLPALLLTHPHTARAADYHSGPATRLLTAHQPPEKPPQEPASPWHAHLPPGPTSAQLTGAIARLLTPAAESGR